MIENNFSDYTELTFRLLQRFTEVEIENWFQRKKKVVVILCLATHKCLKFPVNIDLTSPIIVCDRYIPFSNARYKNSALPLLYG